MHLCGDIINIRKEPKGTFLLDYVDLRGLHVRERISPEKLSELSGTPVRLLMKRQFNEGTDSVVGYTDSIKAPHKLRDQLDLAINHMSCDPRDKQVLGVSCPPSLFLSKVESELFQSAGGYKLIRLHADGYYDNMLALVDALSGSVFVLDKIQGVSSLAIGPFSNPALIYGGTNVETHLVLSNPTRSGGSRVCTDTWRYTF